jgi:hypothetical protein
MKKNLFPTEEEILLIEKEELKINKIKMKGKEYPSLIPINDLDFELKLEIFNSLKNQNVDLSEYEFYLKSKL